MNNNVIDSAAVEGTNTVTQEGDITLKPIYTFRNLKSTDSFLMFNIIGKIGLNNLTKSFDKNAIKGLIEGTKDGEDATTVVGMSIILDMANLVISNIHRCEAEIYELLSRVSDLSVEQIIDLDFVTFTEMVIDFIKKKEFKDFIKVVFRSFNLEI